MTSSEKSNITKRTREEARALLPITHYMDDIFEDFRRDMESIFNSWPYPMAGWHLPVLSDIERGVRLPVSELCDMGDRYELQLEIPGIDKDKIDVKATKNSIEISAEQSEKVEEKRKTTYIMKGHTDHFTEESLYQKRYCHQRLMPK
jgi:HSP20 family protein